MADLDSTGNEDAESESIRDIVQMMRVMPDGIAEHEIALAVLMERQRKDSWDSDIPTEKLDSLKREIMQMISDRPTVKFAFNPHLQTKMVPLYCVPLLFCAALNNESRNRCLADWVDHVAVAALYAELQARDPDTWMTLQSRRGVTPLSLVAMDELTEWADERDLSIAIDELWQSEIAGCAQERDRQLSPTKEAGYLAVIGALARALADAKPDTLKRPDGTPLVGKSDDTGSSGIVGHLLVNGYSRRSERDLRQKISDALKQTA